MLQDPRGVWTLEIKDLGSSKISHGTLREWQLIFHGTKDKPNHQKIEHPDKPRDPAPVPPSPNLGYNSIPSGPTYTFGPPPPPKHPVSYTSYTSTYKPPAPSPTKPVTRPTSQQKQANNPKAMIPYAPIQLQSRPQAHLVVAQVQTINPQLQATLTAQKLAQERARARAFLAEKNAINNLHPIGPLYGPQRTQAGFVPKPPNYLSPQPANYYGRFPPYASEGNIIGNTYIRNRIPFPPAVRWNSLPVYSNPLFRLNPYQYMRTLGRRGLFMKSYQRPKHNRLSKLRKKWRKKGH